MRFTCHRTPPRAFMRSQAPRLHLLTSLLMLFCHVSPNYVIRLCHRWRHLQLDFDFRQLTLSTVDFDFGRVYRWLFVIVDFLQSNAPYPVFRVDFIFAVFFFAYFSYKWRIRTGLLLIATIISINPSNIFANFANILATTLRLAIIATNQLFQFLLLLLLTLRVSNQWLPSLHSLSLQGALSPCP